jgi:hypothetical protein
MSQQPEIFQYLNGSQPWPFGEPVTMLVPTDAPFRAAENQLSSDVRKGSPLLKQMQLSFFMGSAIYTPKPMASNRSGTVFQAWLDGNGGAVTYLKTGAQSWVQRTAAPSIKGSILRTNTLLGGNLTYLPVGQHLELPHYWYSVQKGLQHFGCSMFASYLRLYPNELFNGLSGQTLWVPKIRYPVLLAPTDQAIRNALKDPKVKAIFAKRSALLDLLNYHVLPQARGTDVTPDALGDIFKGEGAFADLSNLDIGMVSKGTLLVNKKVTFKWQGEKLGVLASSDKPGAIVSPLDLKRAFTAPAVQVIVINKLLLP